MEWVPVMLEEQPPLQMRQKPIASSFPKSAAQVPTPHPASCCCCSPHPHKTCSKMTTAFQSPILHPLVTPLTPATPRPLHPKDPSWGFLGTIPYKVPAKALHPETLLPPP
ncbi:hypothetical protein I79_005083 [Cricetulus griseus]|uniref:Uncharacterized protein n=1 Tax=Cricetulus griseus TaxID=10029 RepID=G3H483_CRIGR|nr:hypothetical protein I79_005083 [Cricetulus griseus]